MIISEIWLLPVEQRIAAFIDRWNELDEMTGNRTPAERSEMLEIADAVMGPLIRCWEQRELWKKRLTTANREMASAIKASETARVCLRVIADELGVKQ